MWKHLQISKKLVFKNLKTFLPNDLVLISSLMSFGRLLNNLEAESWKIMFLFQEAQPVAGVAHEGRFIVVWRLCKVK